MAGIGVDEEGVTGDVDLWGLGVGDGEPVGFVSGQAVDLGSGRLEPAENMVKGAVFHHQNDNGFDGSSDFVGRNVSGLGRE